MAGRKMHTSLDIRGCLHNWTDRQMVGMFKHDDGRVMTAREAKDVLMDELAKGHRFLPVGGDCDNFDYVNGGCQGHAVIDDGDAVADASWICVLCAANNADYRTECKGCGNRRRLTAGYAHDSKETR